MQEFTCMLTTALSPEDLKQLDVFSSEMQSTDLFPKKASAIKACPEMPLNKETQLLS